MKQSYFWAFEVLGSICSYRTIFDFENGDRSRVVEFLGLDEILRTTIFDLTAPNPNLTTVQIIVKSRK